MEEDGTLPKFDSTNYGDVLNLARTKGLRQQIMFGAMDILRDNPTLTNSEAVIKSAKKWDLI